MRGLCSCGCGTLMLTERMLRLTHAQKTLEDETTGLEARITTIPEQILRCSPTLDLMRFTAHCSYPHHLTTGLGKYSSMSFE